ncbi:hypothetical protein U0070_010710 [Myodes glareolus]|uniref:Glucuronosyltransferase n=1 Tax=Myodes glareolus TaxID=447135 RepID=A0AAW0H8L1_MYOGA
MLLQRSVGEYPPMRMLRKEYMVWTHAMVKSFSCVRAAQDRVPKVNESTRGTFIKQFLYPQEMEEFEQISGEHGVVVFSLGSMINNTTQERAKTIASALAQIPQKVK